MTLHELLVVVKGPVKLVVHKTDGPCEISFETSAPDSMKMLSSLKAIAPRLLGISVSVVHSENSKLATGAGSFFNDGPAFTVIHVVKERLANELG